MRDYLLLIYNTTRTFSFEPSAELTVIEHYTNLDLMLSVKLRAHVYQPGQSFKAEALCSAVQASAMLSMFISLQILKMNFTETANMA